MTATTTVLILSFALGGAFGALSQKTHFCTMGAVADIINMEDWSRMRMWLLAIGVAILGAGALHASGQIDLGKSIYRTPNFTWLSYLVGGASFGVGMVLASGCGSKTLIRIGSGNLKSLVVFVFLGLAAYMSLRGLFADGRLWLNTVAVQGFNHDELAALCRFAGRRYLRIRVLLPAPDAPVRK